MLTYLEVDLVMFVLSKTFKYLNQLYIHYMQYQKEMVAMGDSVREMDIGYNQRMRDFNSQMPFAFRVQPIQPNLQERE